MTRGHGKGLKNQSGSATIEAVVGFTAFLFAIFTILGMVNFCRAQMMVSAAVDTAAKEMSQYAYFYQMSGLQKFENNLDKNGDVGKKNINEVIGTVDTLYSSLNGAVEQTVQEKTNVANMINAGNIELQTFENAIANIENSANGVVSGINGVSNALKDVGNDPLLYMRSVVALIGSESMEAVKRAVAVPLAKAFVSKHFGSNSDEANERLESLGIEGGLDAMNFNLSNIFSDDKHQDIELTVIYKVKLFQIFDWVILEANVSKVAHCRAWLGGDDVVKKATTAETPPLDSGTSNNNSGENQETTEDNSEATDDNTEDTEEKEEETPSISSTGHWSLQHDPSGYYHSKRCEAFQDQFYEDYFITNHSPYFSYNAREGETVAYDFDVFAKWDYEPYQTLGGDTVDPGVRLLKSCVENGVKGLAHPCKNPDGTIQEFGALSHIIYVPENIPDEQYQALLEDAQIVKAEMEALIKDESSGIPQDIQVNIQIIKSGGQYDYNSSESDYVHIGGVGRE